MESPNKVGKNVVGKVDPKLETFYHPILKTFQGRSVLSNLNENFLTPDFPIKKFRTSRFSIDISNYMYPIIYIDDLRIKISD